MKRIVTTFALTLVATSLTLHPAMARDDQQTFQGAFAVTYAGNPNTKAESYCDPTKTALPIAIEAHGDGYSSLGPFAFALVKGIGFDGTFRGCLTLTAPNGDTLQATYTGAGTASNANNFSAGSGTLTFTGGTGRFHNATGTANWTAYFANIYPASSFEAGGTAPLQGTAYYVVTGTVSLKAED